MASFAPPGRQGRPPRAQHHNAHQRGQPQMQPQPMPMQAHMPPYIYMAATNMAQFQNPQAYIQGYTTPQFIYQQNANPTAMGQQPGASNYYTPQMQMATMSSQVSQPQPGRPPSAPGISSTPATPHSVMSQSVGAPGVSQYTPGTQQQHSQPQLPTPSQGYPLQQPPPHQPAQQQMNTQASQPGAPRYTQPPMQPLRMPLQQQVPMQPPQQQQPILKRTKKPLMIVNPETNDIVNKDYVDASSDPAAPSDPVPARESLPKEEVKPESAANVAVKNQFKALVTSRLQGDEPAENSVAVPAVNGDVEPTSATTQSAAGPQNEDDQVNLVSSTSTDKAVSLDSQPAAEDQCAVISSSNKETESAVDVTTPADAVDSPPAAEQVPADVAATPDDTAAAASEAVSVTDQVPECAAEGETKSSVEVSALQDTTVEITKSSVVVERITPTPVAPLSAPVTPGDGETEAVSAQETVAQQEAEPANKLKVEIVEEPKTEVEPDSPSVGETESKVTVVPNSTPEAVPTDTQLMPPPATPPLEPVEPAAPPSPAPPTEPKTVTLAPSPLRPPGKPNSLNTGMKGSKSVAADMSKLSAESKSFKADNQDMSKKVYDRDFLIRLQFIDLSKQKPKDLPNFAEIVMSEPNSSSRDFKSIRHGKDFDFNPHYFKPSGSPRPSSSKQQRGSMSRESRAPPKSIDYKREGAKLKRSENAWKKAEKVDDEVKSAEQKKEEMLKKFRGQLNKITPQNFQSLSQKILDLGIETESELDGVMRLVFEKAIAEPGFSVTYAQLCHKLSKEFKVTADSDPANEVTFRKLLLVRCQKEFERSNDDDEELVVKSKALKEAGSDTKSRLQEEYDSFLSKARRRKLGNIRFIGELYKLQMLTGKIMHDCIVSLLKSTDEEGYECLCKLLKTIGKFLDQPKAQNLMNQYFAKMKELSENPKKASSRIRFALKDVIELRESNWKPRREDNNPKTIAEVHAEAALEAHETQAMLEKSHITGRGSQSRNPPHSRNRRDEDSGGSGWSTVPVMKTQRIDPTKLRLSKQSDTIQLGPSRGLGGSWSRGSSGSGKNTPPQQQEERPNTPTNRFSALRDGSSEFKEERSSSAQRMPPAGRGRGMPRAGSTRMGSTPRGSMEKERSNAVAAARQISRSSGSRGPSRENSVEGRRNVPLSTRPDSSRRPSDVPGKVPVAVKQLSREEWETKMKGIVEEFLNNRDVKEMMECIKELDAQSNKNLITECSINHVLEKSDSARKAVGNMLAELIKHELLPLDLHLKGVAAVLEFAEDLAIDIPNVWNYLGQLIAPMFTVASIPLSKLEPVCTPLLDIGKSATLAAEILKEASHNSNSSDVGKRWSDSGLTWSTFLPSGEGLDEFIKSNKLEYTLGDTSATSSSSPVSQDLFSTIGPLLQSSDTKSNDQIFDKINASIPEALREEQSFIKSLTTCVAKSCIENGKFVEGIFKNRSAVLTKYLDNRVEREESALIALEELMDELEHPAGLLSDFCYAFSDDDLVSDESFFSWEKNSKSGIAVKSVSNFFKWLREDNDNTQ